MSSLSLLWLWLMVVREKRNSYFEKAEMSLNDTNNDDDGPVVKDLVVERQPPEKKKSIIAVERDEKLFLSHNETPVKIGSVQFSLLSSDEMLRLSEVEISQRHLYVTPTRTPVPFGPLDRRLGTSSKTGTCATCHQKLNDCAGHFGVINLALPVFHIGYFNAIKGIIERICKCCSRVLLKDELQRAEFLTRLRERGAKIGSRQRLVADVSSEARKKKKCSNCGTWNGAVKKIGTLKLIHECYHDPQAPGSKAGGAVSAAAAAARLRKPPASVSVRAEYATALSMMPELTQFVGKAGEDLSPMRVQALFAAMSNDDCELLGLDPATSRPESLVLARLLVPPVCLRPSVTMDASQGSTEDDLTMQLASIVQMNGEIRKNIEKGCTVQTMMEQWQYLQLLTAGYINSDLPGVPSQYVPRKSNRSLCQRLKGKGGRFRGNLSGKRVDFSSRTVISVQHRFI